VADAVDATADHLDVGWGRVVIPGWPWYDKTNLHRPFFYFNTTPIPETAEITYAALGVYVVPGQSFPGNGHEIVLFSGQPTYPSDPLAVGDFNRLLYASGGASNVKLWPGDGGSRSFTFNATGRASWITKGGITKLCLRSEFDVGPTIPGADMLVKFYAAEKGGAYRPVLYVTYGTKPTVTTNAADGLGTSYAIGHGTIDGAGDSAVTEYGVIWNNSGSDPVNIASADHKEVGADLSGGEFSAAMTGLASSTTYNYRAYATNGSGTGYGSAVSFTTTAAPAVLTVKTNEPNSVADTTATLCATLVSDGGDPVIQHGFIWKKNSDPLEEGSEFGGPLFTTTGALSCLSS
jgi:hypothetical protein